MADKGALIKIGVFGAVAYYAYTQGWLSFLGLGTSTASSSAGTTTTAVTTPLVSSPASNQLDTLYTKMVNAATAAGTTSTGVDGWGYYLNQFTTAPDPMPAFQAQNPNFDRSQNMTAAQYWAVIAPVLKTQLGLSGLGLYGGLGDLIRRYR